MRAHVCRFPTPEPFVAINKELDKLQFSTQPNYALLNDLLTPLLDVNPWHVARASSPEAAGQQQ